MHECVNIEISVDDRIDMPITLMRNYLDHTSINVVMPAPANKIQHSNTSIPVYHRATMTASSLNKALTVHEKGLHSSFFLDFKLSQSRQAINMPDTQQLDADCPIFHQCKITRSVTIPGSA